MNNKSVYTFFCFSKIPGINQIINFALQTDSKNSSEFFHIDAHDGIVYLKKSLDHQKMTKHHFIVIASDQGVPSLSSTAHVWVGLTAMIIKIIIITFEQN